MRLGLIRAVNVLKSSGVESFSAQVLALYHVMHSRTTGTKASATAFLIWSGAKTTITAQNAAATPIFVKCAN